MTFLVSIFVVLAGLAFGSFLNVCISRMPRHESVVVPRSRCPRCLTPILYRNNIPLLSWVMLRGRCRHCDERISARYPLTEATTTALFLLCYFEFGLTLRGIGSAVLCWMFLGLAATDAETMRLPDALTLPGIALGVVYSSFKLFGDIPILQPHAVAMTLFWAGCAAALILVIRGLYWLVRRREGIGLGDAKLMAMIAACLGPARAGLVLFVATVSAAAYGLALIAWGGRSRSLEGNLTVRIPLGAFLSAAAILSLFEGDSILAWYLGFFH